MKGTDRQKTIFLSKYKSTDAKGPSWSYEPKTFFPVSVTFTVLSVILTNLPSLGGSERKLSEERYIYVTTNIHMVLKSFTHSASHTDSVETC